MAKTMFKRARHPGGSRARNAQGWMMVALIGSVGGGVLLAHHIPNQAHKGMVYSSQGLGGWVAPNPKQAQAVNDSLQPLVADYLAGNWTDVEAKAADILHKQQFSSDNTERKQAAQAWLMAAYAAAWRKDYPLASERFGQVQTLAGELPDHGAAPFKLGENNATIEEEAAFQQAVCAGATGDRQAAEQGYDGFMQHYPQSVLVHAAMKRVARLHNGDVPADADKLWHAAMRLQKQAENAKRREAALCGPACLAELLRRQGRTEDMHKLADEMHTGTDGTTLANLAQTARRHGFVPRGLMLTPKGLQQQALPLVALMGSSHYVLVGAVTPNSVTVWDPSGNGPNRGASQTYKTADWQKQWTGMALALR